MHESDTKGRSGRGYTAEQYRRLIERIRARIPGVSIATDIIVGFPGETEAQFQRTYDLLAELKLKTASGDVLAAAWDGQRTPDDG